MLLGAFDTFAFFGFLVSFFGDLSPILHFLSRREIMPARRLSRWQPEIFPADGLLHQQTVWSNLQQSAVPKQKCFDGGLPSDERHAQ